MTNWVTKITGNPHQNTSASGFVANRHAAEGLSQIGFKELNYAGISHRQDSDEVLDARVAAMLAGVQPGDMVIVQYPTWTNDPAFDLRLIEKLDAIPNVKKAIMVWDVMVWVRHEEQVSPNNYNFRVLNRFDLVIAANPKMAKRLHDETVIDKPILSMDFSDSIYRGPLAPKGFEKKLWFVGSNLNDNMIQDYAAQTPFHMIGNYNGQALSNPAITLHGAKSSDEVTAMLDGGFGVVQYAKPVRYQGMQKYGEYNNPLKLSHYLAAGIPVIIGSQMAHVEFVKAHNIGIVLDDLNDVDRIFKEISQEEYQAMLEAVKPFQRAISSGFFAKRAGLEAQRILQLGFTDSLAQQQKGAKS
jgi:hypothetical protein